jgi:glycosyltransferase involved in cell wall biosynthesis
MPKISVVIPTYNSARFLGEAIQSVLDQTIGDFEIIVIDDGSTDNTPEIVTAFPVRYFRQENQGVSGAENRGAALSSAEYITFLYSDDVMYENALENGVDVLNKHPESAFSYGQAHFTDEDGHIIGVLKLSFLECTAVVDGREEIRDLFDPYRIIQSGTMIRRRCFNEIGGFCRDLNIGEDHLLFTRLATRWSAIYVAQPVVQYRLHPGSLSQRINPKVAEMAFLLIFDEMNKVCDDLSCRLMPWKSYAHRYYYQKISGYCFGKDMGMAHRCWRKGIRAYPQMLSQPGGLSIICEYAKSLLPSHAEAGFIT